MPSRRFAWLAALPLAVAAGLLGNAYFTAEDPPLWPRGERFCDPATITAIVPGEDAYERWDFGDHETHPRIRGHRYFHPVSSAHVALDALGRGDRETALATAELMDDEADNGWLPYWFSWDWADGHRLNPPWYSAMAQGMALSVHSRLGDVERSREAFRTVVALQRGDGWLPEYPAGPDVLNGHIFATFGLYDYWQLTGEGEADAIKAIQVVAERLPEFRRVGRVSRYAAGYPAAEFYHEIHVRQLDTLARLTGATCFEEAARAFEADT